MCERMLKMKSLKKSTMVESRVVEKETVEIVQRIPYFVLNSDKGGIGDGGMGYKLRGVGGIEEGGCGGVRIRRVEYWVGSSGSYCRAL
ncbi:hypothetical protein Tco_1027826 [Tanacetum coccineum]